VATGVLNFGKEIIRDFLCSSFRASWINFKKSSNKMTFLYRMFHPKHVEQLTGNKMLYKSVTLLEHFLK
jgi:hypothetical protein